MRNLISNGMLLAFGLVSSTHAETTLKFGDYWKPPKGKSYPPGSPVCYSAGSFGNLGCTVFEGEPLKGTSLALSLVGALVFAASVVAYIFWGIR